MLESACINLTSSELADVGPDVWWHASRRTPPNVSHDMDLNKLTDWKMAEISLSDQEMYEIPFHGRINKTLTDLSMIEFTLL